ncbi:MAG TPA: hypothetical protein VGG29_18855 [Caulobacteraceae bacterium]|jgi:MFS family permease
MSPASSVDERPPSAVKAMVVVYAIAILGTGLAALGFMFAMKAMAARHVGLAGELGATLAFGATILGIAFASATAGRRMARTHTPTPAARRYLRRFFIAQTCYVLLLTAAVFAYRVLPHGSPLLWLAAIAPAVAVLAVIVIMGLYLAEETDEFERAIQSQAALWATGGLLALATLWGFLELFDLAPHVESWAAFVVWAVLLGLAQPLVRRRYR